MVFYSLLPKFQNENMSYFIKLVSHVAISLLNFNTVHEKDIPSLWEGPEHTRAKALANLHLHRRCNRMLFELATTQMSDSDGKLVMETSFPSGTNICKNIKLQ